MTWARDQICDLCGFIHPHKDAPHSIDGLVATIERLRHPQPHNLFGGSLFVRNDSLEPYGIVHVIDPRGWDFLKGNDQ